MTNNRTFFLIIMDRSGSMAFPPNFRTDMEGGINTFLEEQKKVPGKCRVNFVQFDNEYEEVFTNMKLKEVPTIQLQPRGSTALLDAMGKSISNLKAHIDSLPKDKKPDKILVTIITDGEENSSREWNRDRVFKLVTQCTNDGWEFTFLGANQDAIKEAQKMGVSVASAMTYAPEAAVATMDYLSDNVTAYRSGMVNTISYSGTQRANAMGSKDSDDEESLPRKRSRRPRR